MCSPSVDKNFPHKQYQLPGPVHTLHADSVVVFMAFIYGCFD